MTASPAISNEGGAVYTPKEAAALLKLNEVTVYKYIREGRLPARRIGNRNYRVTQADIDTFLSKLTTDENKEDEE